jgi:nitroreductase
MSEISALLNARYGSAAPALAADAVASSDLLGSILAHRSVRAYLPDALPPGTLELLVAAAQSAPTSSNLQPWSVVAVEGKAHKARLAALAHDQKQIHEAPLFLVWLADLSRLRRVASAAGTASDGLDYLESFVLAVIDATLAAQNAVVAAESLGLGTVYIGAIRNETEKVAAELDLPPGVFPVFGLTVGKPDPARPADVKPRLPQAAVLHRETYQTASESDALAAYDTILAAFQKAQNLPALGWTKQAAQRITTAALGPRARLAAAVAALGFKLR